MRWKLVEEEDGGQGALFAEDDIVDRHVGTGEYRGLEFLHVRAKKIINEVPAAANLPFRWTINAYRGCSHACVYCVGADTPVLMADGTHRRIADVGVGDAVYGTERVGSYRRLVRTTVLAHWRTEKPAYRVTLADGTELIASGDHRFLTERGWKFVTGRGCGDGQRPHLTTNNSMIGVGRFSEQPKHDDEYRRGYLTGMIRGDGCIHHKPPPRPTHQFRLALKDDEALRRTERFLASFDLAVDRFLFAAETAHRREMWAIRTQSGPKVAAIERLIEWPEQPSDSWRRGFLAGIFDAEGSYSRGVLRICNGDPVMIAMTTSALERFGFGLAIERRAGTNFPIVVVRVRGGQAECLRFFHTVDPAISRKRSLLGQAIKNGRDLRVDSVEDIGLVAPMYDITTGTGDFVANGVVSHNCFARPTHDYLGLNIGSDFDSKIVVKVNAVERLRAELSARRWAGDPIAMGTNTDPYQRCEGKYHLTQGIVRVLGEFANPFSILTKSTLILRDLPLLVEAAERTDVRVNFSIGTLDEKVWKATEPGTPHPRRRIEAVRRINDAGIPCGVLVAPLIPGMSDTREHIDEVVSACVEAGAVSIMGIPLHLRKGVKDHFMGWLRANRPDLVADYERRYRGSRLAKADQEAIAGLVRRARAEAGAEHVPAGNPTSHTDVRDRARREPPPEAAAPTEPEVEQPTLFRG